MSLIYPTFEELSAQITAAFRTDLPSVDPTVFGSWAMAFANGNAALAQSIFYLVRDLEKQLFPQTATGDFLDQWGAYETLTRLEDAASSGTISVTGTATTVVPNLTNWTGSNDITYQSTASATIVATSQACSLASGGGFTAGGICSSPHQLATGMTVAITSVNPLFDHPTALILGVNSTAFSYNTLTSFVAASTGDVAVDVASVKVEAQTDGAETNLGSGSVLTLAIPISGVDDTALAQSGGMSGGADEETDDAYRERVLLSRSLISGVFTPDQIKLAVFSIAGNTRVWVKKPTVAGAGIDTDPSPGQCSVFFLRDDDASGAVPAESSDVMTATYAAIIDSGALPANMVSGTLPSDADLFLQGPSLVPRTFTFTALSPDSPTMRTAVENQLQAFFDDSVDFEEDVLLTSIYGALQNTQDLETGEFISSYTLTVPSADWTASAGEIATLGTITWF